MPLAGYAPGMGDLSDAPYTDPTGPDPEAIPDPMPEDLQRSEEQAPNEEAGEPMGGPAPTG